MAAIKCEACGGPGAAMTDLGAHGQVALCAPCDLNGQFEDGPDFPLEPPFEEQISHPPTVIDESLPF